MADTRGPDVATAHAPAGKRAEHPLRAGDGPQRFVDALVRRIEPGHLGIGVELRCGQSDRLDGATTVADPEKRSRIQAASHGPPAPLQLDPRGAFHQHTVEVEQDGRAFEPSHGR